MSTAVAMDPPPGRAARSSIKLFPFTATDRDNPHRHLSSGGTVVHAQHSVQTALAAGRLDEIRMQQSPLPPFSLGLYIGTHSI